MRNFNAIFPKNNLWRKQEQTLNVKVRTKQVFKLTTLVKLSIKVKRRNLAPVAPLALFSAHKNAFFFSFSHTSSSLAWRGFTVKIQNS